MQPQQPSAPPAIPGTQRLYRLLSIAGSSSSGGAGIQADLKTFAALGVFGLTAITAVTAQSPQGVRAIHPIPPGTISAQIEAIMGDMGADAIKIGMLHDTATLHAVAHALRRWPHVPVVLDPVMISSSGTHLMQPAAIQELAAVLFAHTHVITPNLDEAALLLNRPVQSLHHESGMRQAARDLQRLGASAVLIKGGHLPAAGAHHDHITDMLRTAEGDEHIWRDTRIATHNTHGTGCTLSSALATWLALGHPLPEAVTQARLYVRHALLAATRIHAGQSATGQPHNGPLNHSFAPCTMRLREEPMPHPGRGSGAPTPS